MARRSVLTFVLGAALLAGCARAGGGSSAPSPLDLAAVTAALRGAGITVAVVADNVNPRDGAWRCLSGSFKLARVEQQPVAAHAGPGDRPSVDVLVFSSANERTTAQASIGTDGQVRAAGCGTMVDWVAAPHTVGARNVLLFMATNDPVALAELQAAAATLGG
jgi:hypothetical protein